MALFAIGDLHLSLGGDKPMDVFSGWKDYVKRLEEGWHSVVKPEDTVVLVGDSSWAMHIKNAIKDFTFIHKLPGRKIILKGNHDYWWASVTSMLKVLHENGLDSIHFLHNNSYMVGDVALCGSRGWIFETSQEQDAKLVRREAIRMENSLLSAPPDCKERILFLHYPPVYGEQEIPEYLELMEKYSVKRCYYGHIHGDGHRYAVEGPYKGTNFFMTSGDYLNFTPLAISLDLE